VPALRGSGGRSFPTNLRPDGPARSDEHGARSNGTPRPVRPDSPAGGRGERRSGTDRSAGRRLHRIPAAARAELRVLGSRSTSFVAFARGILDPCASLARPGQDPRCPSDDVRMGTTTFGSPAVSKRPVALRPSLATGLPLSCHRRERRTIPSKSQKANPGSSGVCKLFEEKDLCPPISPQRSRGPDPYSGPRSVRAREAASGMGRKGVRGQGAPARSLQCAGGKARLLGPPDVCALYSSTTPSVSRSAR
jgi:hypothetical protein